MRRIAQLRLDLDHIDNRGATASRIEMTRECVEVLLNEEVANGFIAEFQKPSSYPQQVYGVPVVIVPALPNGLMYHIVVANERAADTRRDDGR